MRIDGVILKGIGGFYYVEAAGDVYECRAKGLFRKEGITPFAGDRVVITIGEKGTENIISEIHKRKNLLKRPPVANVDRLFVVASIREPLPNLTVIDRLCAAAEFKDIEPVVVVAKSDLGDVSEIFGIYSLAGIKTIAVSAVTGENIQSLKDELSGHISAFAGNSGVGKSTLLNSIDSRLRLETAEISRKLGRGRHTTRHVELFKVEGGYVADTPGFSSFDTDTGDGDFISKDNLQFCFKEFKPHIGKCRYSTCAHVNDSGCKIIEAVEAGQISVSRHQSYVTIYNEVKAVKDWQIQK